MFIPRWKQPAPPPAAPDLHPNKDLVIGKHYFAEFNPGDTSAEPWGIYAVIHARATESESPTSDVFWATCRQNAEQLVKLFDAAEEADRLAA